MHHSQQEVSGTLRPRFGGVVHAAAPGCWAVLQRRRLHVVRHPRQQPHKRSRHLHIDLEKTRNQALFSGVSTKGGETITSEFRNAEIIAAGDFMEVYQVTDVIANLRMGACDVLD